MGEYVSNEEYFTKIEFLSAYAANPYYDHLSGKFVIHFSTVLLSKVIREPIGIIVNQIKLEQNGDGGLIDTSGLFDHEKYHSQLVTSNKTRIIDFSSDGFIRDCAENIILSNDREQYNTDRLNTYLSLEKLPIDDSILAMHIVDLTGKIASSTEIGQVGKDISNEVSFSDTLKYGAIITDLHYSPIVEESSLDISSFIFGKRESNTIGMIITKYSGKSLRKSVLSGISEESGQGKQSEGLGETGKLLLVNSDKLMITGSRSTEVDTLKQVVDTEGVRIVLENGVGMTGIYPDHRGIPVLGVSRYIKDIDWVVLAEKDISEAFAPIVYLRNLTIVMGIIGITVIVAIAFFLATGITKHIRRLKKGTERIVEGDLERPVAINKMEKETKELGESFNLMMKKLRESRERNIQLFLDVKQSRDEWQKTFDAITDIITIHSIDFRIIRANKAFFEKFEIDRKRLSDKRCCEIFYGNNTHMDKCLLSKCAISKKPEISEVDNFKIGGSFLTFAYPLMDERGEIYRFVHLARDITYQKNLQRLFVDKASKLVKANRELEQLSYIVAELSGK